MQTVYKYDLELTDEQTILLPRGAVLLSLQPQHNKIKLWAMVDTFENVERRTILIRGTGHALDRGRVLRHISTFQRADGDLVFHAFEGVPA